MAKTRMLCPFTYKLCSDCYFYRGRHYYLSLCQRYRGYIGEPKAVNNRSNNHITDIRTFDKSVAPWSQKHNRVETEPDITLKVRDMETEETRIRTPAEARDWDWSSREMIRMIDGRHITSWEKLLEILHYKAARGYQEAVLYEGPRFMLLGGG